MPGLFVEIALFSFSNDLQYLSLSMEEFFSRMSMNMSPSWSQKTGKALVFSLLVPFYGSIALIDGLKKGHNDKPRSHLTL